MVQKSPIFRAPNQTCLPLLEQQQISSVPIIRFNCNHQGDNTVLFSTVNSTNMTAV